MGRDPLLDLSDVPKLEKLRNQGMTYREIGLELNVSHQTVSNFIKANAPHLLTARQVVSQHFPWRGGSDGVTTEMQKASVYKRMRDFGEWAETNGEGMSAEKLRRLRTWLSYLRRNNVVLEFDPTIPPIDGISPHGGFAYRERVESDGRLLFRVNRWTIEMTPEMYSIWELPEPEESP